MDLRSFGKDKIKVITHSGNFHADEVFAVAALFLLAEKEGKELEIVRTRDESEFQKADILIDVGMGYEPEKFRFDHHQKGGAGFHFENPSLPYASFGLVWKHFGEEICGDMQIVEKVEKKLVVPIDARDNGINITKNLIEGVVDYSLSRELVYAFRPTFEESLEKSDEKFFELMQIFKNILENEIKLSKSEVSGERKVLEEIKKQQEPEILILEDNIFWDEIVSKYKNITIVIVPEKDINAWSVETARDDTANFDSNRAIFPKEWHGLRNGDLADVSGIHDAIFCHRNGFFAVAKSKESAILMAKMALGKV